MPGSLALSIVICTFNRAASLEETLASVNECELPPACDVELLVIDNNSPDATPQVCANFARKARMPFRRVLETSQGLSFARNRGIQEADGDVIIFTDDDVIVTPQWLLVYAREFADNGVDWAFGRVRPEWNGEKPEWFSDALKPAYALLDYGNSRMIVSTPSHEFFGANFAVRKDVVREAGGFDVKLGRTSDKLFIGEETRLFRELLRRSRRIAYNPAIDVRHVIEPRRKEKAYLFRYFHDTAASLVVATRDSPGNRRLLGIPYFRVKELIRFYALLVPRALKFKLRRDAARLFALHLHLIRANRTLALHLKEWREHNTVQRPGSS